MSVVPGRVLENGSLGICLSRSHLMCLYKTDVNVNLHRLTVQKTESYWSKKMPE